MKGIEIEAYSKGFHDGARIDPSIPTTIMLAGYKFDKILELVLADQEKKVMATTLHNRSELEKKLADIGTFRDINGRYYILDVLEALGLLHFLKEISPERKALCSIMTETEVRMGEDFGKLTCGHISEYGSGCIIDGLMTKGYKIVKI